MKKEPPKKIVYLFGAGASQAELSQTGLDNSVLARDISLSIFDKPPKQLKYLQTHLSSDTSKVNIEHLISLIESIGSKKYLSDAVLLRREYQLKILKGLSKNTSFTPINPTLTQALLWAHKSKSVMLKEQLTGIICLNYDNLLEKAFEKVYGGVNYGFRVNSNPDSSSVEPLLLKLHGSFNWKLGKGEIGLDETKSFLKSCDSVWVPPSTNKETRSYPFNLIWGRAHELLSCNVLRIIGCSLHQNDWGLLSLLFKQQLSSEKPYSIEFINSFKTYQEVKAAYPFLTKFNSFYQIPYSGAASDDDPNGEETNHYRVWLVRKLRDLKYSGVVFLDEEKVTINKLLGEEVI